MAGIPDFRGLLASGEKKEKENEKEKESYTPHTPSLRGKQF